jgi:hypothetical protein
MPLRFERQVAFLKSSPNLLVCGSWTKNIDENDNEVAVSQGPTDIIELNWLAIFRPPFAHPTAMFRATCFSDSKVKYDESYRTAQDFEMWSRLHKIGELGQIPEYLVKYRTHSNNVSTKRKVEQNANAANVCFLNIQHYFPEVAVEYGEHKIKMLCQLIYGAEQPSNVNTAQCVSLLICLQDCYLNKVNPNKIMRKKIGQLTIRWIVQGLLVKSQYSFKQKLVGSIFLFLRPILVVSEALDFITRKR